MSDRVIRGGPVRARDLRSAVAELGFEMGVVTTLERLLDEYATHRQQLRELTQLVDRCIDEVSKMVSVGSSMREQIDRLKRERDLSEDITDGH